MSKALFLTLFAILLALTSCQNNDNTDDLKIFKYNEAKSITSLDPAFAKYKANIWVVNQLFNGLVQLDKDLNVVPCIAKSWEISEDGLTYTFHLINDVYFHEHELFNGIRRVVTAEDFVYSFNRILDPEVASSGSWIFNGKVDTISPFTALDENTLQIRLLKPFRPFLGILCMQYCSVVPKEIAEHYVKDFRNHPIGTGPFILKVWKEGEVIFLVKNNHYFEKIGETRLPYLDGVKITFLQEKNMEFLKLKQNDLDMVAGIDGKTVKDDILTKDGKLLDKLLSKFKLIRSPYLNTEYFGILANPENPKMKGSPLLIKEVRQAMNYCIDRQQMISFLRNNISIPANSGFIPPGLPSYDPTEVNGYQFDLEKAKDLLVSAGFPGGEGIPEFNIHTTSANIDICTFIQNQLKEIGIKTAISPIQPGNLLEMTTKYDAPFFRGNWIADYPDGESFLAMFYSKNPAPPNYTGFNNSEFDSLYVKALAQNDNAKRYLMYQEMDKILIEEAPVIFLYYDEVLRFVRNNVHGLENNAINLLTLKKVRLFTEKEQ